MRAASIVSVLILCVFRAASSFAQQPPFVNAHVVSRSAGPDLARAVSSIVSAQDGAAWVGYSIAVLNGGENFGNDGWSERCRLEQNGRVGAPDNAPAGPIRLEPSPTAMVLARVNNRAIERIRTFSSDCQIDAGGLTLYWLDPVEASQSVAFLKTFVADGTTRNLSEPSLAAIARHRDPAAAAALLDLARHSATPRVRQRSLFWIARRAGSEAASTISQAIDQDPDAEVKKQAVLALGQLPRNEGIPLLIDLARTSKNPAVRRQAMISLGQSKDPRALTFFEDVLK